MTQRERMLNGLIYDLGDKDITKDQHIFLDKLWEFNQLKPTDVKNKEKYMKEIFAECGEDNYIELPFHANWGGANVHFGNNIYANSNLTIVDDGQVFVGDYVMFGPNVTIATAGHPVNAKLRKKALQFNKDVHIEENVWIGANVVIVPGITIGKNSVIGAGSVVTKDIPENVIAYGNPCKVARNIDEHDDEYFYKKEKIDWENL